MERSNDQQASPENLSLPRGRAVVVDKDRRDLQSFTGTLQRMGFEVKPFTNYQEALHCLDEETLDFVLVDQGGKEFETRGVVQRALARNRHTPVVVLAQCLDIGCYLEAMQLGAVDYLEKPLAPAEVENLVTTYLRPRGLGVRHQA